MLDDIATNEVKTVNTAAGLPINDPAEREAMESLAKYKQSAGYIGKSALTGAAMGIQAGQGAMNPMTAFIQGAAAGLQAPAQVFAQKQAQVKSTLDAMPFGVRFEELIKQNPKLGVFAGMPSALALEAMKEVGVQSIKEYEASKARMDEKKIEYIQPGADAENAAKLLEDADPEHKPRNPKSLVGMPKDSLQHFIKTGSEAQSQYFRGGRKLTESEMGELADMVHRNDTSIADTLSTYQRAQLALIYSRKYPGDSLTMRVAYAKNITNPQVQKQLRTMASVIYPSETGSPSLADQLIAKHAALSNSKYSGPWDSFWNTTKTLYKSMTGEQKLNDFISLRNTYAMEVAAAMTGGVPTDARLKQELEPLDASLPHSAFEAAIENSKEAIGKRIEEYTKIPDASMIPGVSSKIEPDGIQTQKPKTTVLRNPFER